MTRLPARHAARPEGVGSNDAGFTLIEMVVTSSLLLLIVGIILSAFTSFQSAVASNASRQTTIQQAELAMQTLTRDFRDVAPSAPPTQSLTVAPDFSSATSTSATFRANLDTTSNGSSGSATGFNGCPDQVALSVGAGGTLTETRVHGTAVTVSPTYPTGCSWGGASTKYTVATGVAINLVYLAWSDPSTWTTSTTVASPPAVSLAQIAFVRITVTATSTRQSVGPTTITQTVRLALTSPSHSNG